MSKICHTGFSQVQRLCGVQTDEASVQGIETVNTSGMQGEPLPYSLRTDWAVTGVIFFCFFLTIYAIRNGGKILYHNFKNLFRNRKRSNMFDGISTSYFRYTLALSCVYCIVSGTVIYDYLTDLSPELLRKTPHILLLGIYVSCIMLIVCVKWFLYRFVNWVFFEKNQNDGWISSYFTILGACGLVQSPFILVMFCLDLSPAISLRFVAFTLICSKILLFYKSVRNFFNHFHVVLHLILYFCTLEIAPLLFLWKGLGYINDILILKF